MWKDDYNMVTFKYINIRSGEILRVIWFSIIFAFLFSCNYMVYFSNRNSLFSEAFLVFFFFILIFFGLRIFLMKLYAYKFGFDLEFDFSYFDVYGDVKYKTLTSKQHSALTLSTYYAFFNRIINIFIPTKNKGIPYWIFTFVFAVLSGFLILFSFFHKFNIKKIKSSFIGTKSSYEVELFHIRNIDISTYRITRVFLFGSFIYFLMLMLIKLLFYESPYFHLLFFIIFMFFLSSLVPFFDREGFAPFNTNSFKLCWFISLLLLFFGTPLILILDSVISIILMTTLLILLSVLFLFFTKSRK